MLYQTSQNFGEDNMLAEAFISVPISIRLSCHNETFGVWQRTHQARLTRSANTTAIGSAKLADWVW